MQLLQDLAHAAILPHIKPNFAKLQVCLEP